MVKWLIFASVLVMIFLFGIAYGQTIVEPQIVAQTEIVTRTEYVPKYIIEEVEVIREIEVTKEVYPTEFRSFESQEQLGRWQAKHYLELQELGKQNKWVCVDYALEMQKKAWLEGYLMSTETIIYDGGKTGHMINSTIIGDDIIFLEPQSTKNWIGGVKADYAQLFSETGEAFYREEY